MGTCASRGGSGSSSRRLARPSPSRSRSHPRRRRPATAAAAEPQGIAGITGIVLAGGRSTRFGRDKLAEPYRGRPLLEHVVLALGAVCGEVVIVLAPGAELTPMPIVARVTHDEVEGQGPLVGAAAGLREARGELAVLGGGDMPGLVPAVLRLMLAVAERNERVRAVVLRDADRFRPLPSVVRVAPARAAVAEELGEGGRRLRDAIARLEPVILDETEWTSEDPGRRTLFDVDEPSDLGD